jgi:hypothetical protein
MENYIKLMRPKHWVKNLLIFLPSALASEFDKIIGILVKYLPEKVVRNL